MEFINQPRGSGKTTKLIKKSAETGAVILVATGEMAKCIEFEAKILGYKIPKPMSLYEYQRNKLNRNSTHVLIDELVILLQFIFSGVEIDAVTLSEENIKYGVD